MADQKKNQSGGFNPIGLCLGLGVGLCFGTALDNMGLGICLGMGIGLCFSVALGQAGASEEKKDEGADDKTDNGSGEEQK